MARTAGKKGRSEMQMKPPTHGRTAAVLEEFADKMARHLAARAAAGLAMAGQSYRIEVRPDVAYDELVRLLQPWVVKNVECPASDGNG